MKHFSKILWGLLLGIQGCMADEFISTQDPVAAEIIQPEVLDTLPSKDLPRTQEMLEIPSIEELFIENSLEEMIASRVTKIRDVEDELDINDFYAHDEAEDFEDLNSWDDNEDTVADDIVTGDSVVDEIYDAVDDEDDEIESNDQISSNFFKVTIEGNCPQVLEEWVKSRTETGDFSSLMPNVLMNSYSPLMNSYSPWPFSMKNPYGSYWPFFF